MSSAADQPSWKGRIAWLLGALAVSFVALNVFAYNHAHSMMYFTAGGPRTHGPGKLNLPQKLGILLTGVNVPRPMGSLGPEQLSPRCRPVSIPGAAGMTLAAWFLDQGPKTPLVVLFHGYAADKPSLLPEARAFAEIGASVLMVDFRGSGGSSESYTTVGVVEADDVAAAMRFASSLPPHPATLLFGQSMGAAAILRSVARNGIKPDAVILEAVYDTMLHTVEHRFQAMGVPSFPSAEFLLFWGGVQGGFNGFDHNPVEYARSLRCPALFMHGRLDPSARLEEGRQVFAAAPGLKTFTEFPSLGHQSYVASCPQQWKACVGAFLVGQDRMRARLADPRVPGS